MALKIGAKFKGKLTLMGSFYTKSKMYEYRGVMCYGNEE